MFWVVSGDIDWTSIATVWLSCGFVWRMFWGGAGERDNVPKLDSAVWFA